MGNKEKIIVKSMFVIGNIAMLGILLYLILSRYIIFEVFMALLFLQLLFATFMIFQYMMHKKMKKLAEKLGFTFITRFLEQPRMEGMYKDNWFQLHFTSRSYSEYWGMPKTYIKLQFKEAKKYNLDKLKKYENFKLAGFTVKNIEYVNRPYKNYLLMRLDWYIIDGDKLKKFMDLLIKIEKEAKLK